MYEFDDAKQHEASGGGTAAVALSNQTMWLTDARNTRICPHAGPNFHCFKIPTARDETIAAFFVRTDGCVCLQRAACRSLAV